jgi:phospholipid/cholesterol/gamma-HCH transport system ATP-binding protein
MPEEKAESRPVIRVEHLVAAYDDNVILDDVNLTVHAGERLFIVGGSGCGKTTLLRHLIGLQQPASGRVWVLGEEIGGGDEEALARIQRRVGVSFQAGALFASLTLGQNVALPLEEYTTLAPETIRRLVRMKLSMVKLAGYEDFMISELSGGMKKRAALARAVALDPGILFFDEPSAGLDPVTSVELDELILQVNESLGTTIVVVSHELASIFRVASRVVMLDRSTRSIIAEGDPKELRDRVDDERVHGFFNREPGPEFRDRRRSDVH